MKQFYGLLSNGQTAALVSSDASIDWLAFPDFDSDTVFCRLLDPLAGGFMSLRPESHFRADQAYLPGSLVLETRLRTPSGVATVDDYLVIGRTELRRFVRSEVPLVLDCQPRFGYGQSLGALRNMQDGLLWRNPHGSEGLLLTLRGPKARCIGREQWLLPPGEHEVALLYTPDFAKEQGEFVSPQGDPAEHLDDALRYWRQAPMPRTVPALQHLFERSVLTMRALTVRTTGAVLAAPTTSLPEQIGGERNWDYRFVWVRDASYAAEAFLLSGDVLAARRLIEFLLNSVQMTGKPFVSPFLRGDGSFSLGERELGWLAGHRQSLPVRVGNAASAQLQLDIEGDLLWALWRYVQDTGDWNLPCGYWWAIERMADWTADHWREADASLWEFRDTPRHYTHSLVLCWVALFAAASLAKALGRRDKARHWHEQAARVRTLVEQECYRPDLGSFTQGVGIAEVDAALLCLPLYGFVSAEDPAWRATLRRIEQDLVRDGLVYRYGGDSMGPARHPFTLGSTWLARVYLRSGRQAEAMATLEQLGQVATPLGLWGEHVDPVVGEQRGNFPQLFPHAGFVAAASELARSEAGAGPDPAHTGTCLGDQEVAPSDRPF